LNSESSFTAQVIFPKKEELEFIKKAVSIDSSTLSQFLRNAGLRKAREIFKEVEYQIPLSFNEEKFMGESSKI